SRLAGLAIAPGRFRSRHLAPPLSLHGFSAPSLPGFTRQSFLSRQKMDPRVNPAGDDTRARPIITASRSVIARESGRSSNHLFSIGAQPMTRWLLDAPLSRGMTACDSVIFAGALRNQVLDAYRSVLRAVIVTVRLAP